MKSRMSDTKISVCLLTRNEERYIGDTIRRLYSYVDEFVIVDGLSSDRTEERAKKFKKVRFYKRKFSHNFAAERNFCALLASNDWILTLDAHEFLSKNLLHNLRKIVKKNENVWVIFALRKHIIGRKTVSSYYAPLLYKKSRVKFIGTVHEKIVPNFSTNGLYCFIRPITKYLLKEKVVSLPPEYIRYHITKKEIDPRKNKYYARLEAKELSKFFPLYIPLIYFGFVVATLFYFLYVYRRYKISLISTKDRFITLVYMFHELFNNIRKMLGD